MNAIGAHRRVVGVERYAVAQELAREYESGASIRDLSDQTQRSYGFVHRILRESGVALRRRGGWQGMRAATETETV